MIKKVLITCAFIFLTALLIVSTPWFKNQLFELVKERIELQTGMRVNADGFEYHFPLKLAVHNIALGSPEDPDLTIAEVNLHLSAIALWKSAIVVHDLEVNHVVLHRPFALPQKGHTDEPWELPLPCTIRRFQITDVNLDPRLPSLTLTGDLEAEKSTIDSHLECHSLEGYFLSKIQFTADQGFHAVIEEGTVDAIDFSGNIALNPSQHLDGTVFSISVRELEELTPHMRGSLAIECSLKGEVLRPDIQVVLDSNQLFALGYHWEALSGNIESHYRDGIFNGNLSLDSKGKDYSLETKTNFEWLPDAWLRLPHFTAKGPLTAIEGSLQANLSNFTYDASVQGKTSDLTLIEEWLGKEVRGSLAFDTRLFHDEKGQNCTFSAVLDEWEMDQFSGKNGSLAGSFTNINEQPKGDFSLNLPLLIVDNQSYEGLVFESRIDPNEERWPFTFNCRKGADWIKQGSLSGNWKLEENSLLISLLKGDATIAKQRAELKQPLHARFSKEIVNVSLLAVTLSNGGAFYANFDLNGSNINGQIDAENIPLDMIQSIDSSLHLTGGANATLVVKGTLDQPEGKLNLSLRDVKFQEATLAPLPPLSAELNGDLKNHRIEWTGEIKGLEEKPITMNASLPLEFSLAPLLWNVDFDEDISALFSVQGDIIPILQLFVADITTLTGKTEVTLEVKGTLNHPDVSGHARLYNGTFESVETGAAFKDIKASLTANGSQIIIDEITASDKFGGSILGKGTLQLDGEYPYQLDMNITKARFFNSDFADAVFSGALQLSGTIKEAMLKGKIEADAITVVIPEDLPEATHSVDVAFINRPIGERAPQLYVKTKNDWPLKLDLDVASAKTISIKGTDLVSTWKGNVHIQGTPANPEIFGDLKIEKGSYNFNGKEFLINQGTVTFAGDPEKKTSLYVIASYDLDKIIAEVILRGSIKNPTISFRSNPPLSQREILAWILFGRGVSDISATEGAQLNQSITNLKSSGKSGKGPDMLTKLRKSFGIDRIDINRGDSEDSNQVSVQVGKYISKGVYVSVNKSVTAESNQVAIEANLTKEIKVQAEVGDDSEGQLLLKWKKDY